MNEVDLGRLLPLLVLWIIWMLVTRRRGKEQVEIPLPPPAGETGAEDQWPWPEESAPPLDGRQEEYRPFPAQLLTPAPEKPVKRRPAAAPAATRVCPRLDCRVGLSRRELRRLVVWSEILAPPLGVRRDDRSGPR